MIKLSVLLPMFKAREIGWLPFEGLLRQQGINFQWEIIIAEERGHKPFGEDRVREYQSKLADIGCARIRYLSLTSWIPLAAKWRLLAKNMCCSSVTAALHAADAFSQPRRLITNHRMISGGADWAQSPFYLLYNIPSDKSVVLYRRKGNPMGNRHPCGENMAVRSDMLRRLPSSSAKRSVDAWLFRSVRGMLPRMTVAWDKSDNWKQGMNTVGFNCISKYGDTFVKPRPPFAPLPFDIRSTIPEDIMTRLDTLRS